MRFDPDTYPGPRPDGPVLVWRGEVWPVSADGSPAAPVRAHDAEAAEAPVLSEALRWVLSYGANASPDRLVDKGLDEAGAVLLPAVVKGWTPAWEARRSTSTGAVPLTLVPDPGAVLRTWVLGIRPEEVAALDSSEFRGDNYLLGHLGEAAVAARWRLADVLAYGPGPETRCLLTSDGQVARFAEVSQDEAARLLDAGAPTRKAAPLPARASSPEEEPWPMMRLDPLPLFVYGTLRPGRTRWPQVEALVTDAGEATVHGTHVDTGFDFPGVRLDGDGEVRGHLLEPQPETASEFYRLVDAIEQEPDLYRRVAVHARTDDGRRRWAALYEWNRTNH